MKAGAELCQALLVCELGPHAQFHNHRITPSGRKVKGREEKKAGAEQCQAQVKLC